MKNLLILVLMLGMTSTAGAAVSLGGVIDGEIDVGTTGIVTVISDDTSNWAGVICFDPPIGVSPILPPGPFAGDDASIIPPPCCDGCYDLMAADFTEPFDSIQAGVWFEFSVYGAAVDDVYTVDLYASDFVTILDTGTVTVVPEPECFPYDHPDYSEWLAVGMPECWCYPRQCHGDADGLLDGCPKCSYYYVNAYDLGCLLMAWKVKEPPHGPGIGSVPNGICADFDHQQEGDPKGGYFRVGAGDLGILLSNWKILEPPEGPGTPPDCLDVP